ncbi:MAG: hypothetical protein LBR08_02615 [Bacteroidales bacterium]|nr:hypothetical protein [Bacteroidales bacterium]
MAKSVSQKSYADRISAAQVMSSALQANSDLVGRRGVNTGEYAGLLDKAIVLNNTQEKLKADLKAATAELDGVMAELNKQTAHAKKIVKMDIPKVRWKEFGISDKQ